ncbi:MAG: hypothetical protein ACUVV4_04915 [Candidatus Bathyarchaeia archaeon]
METANEKAKYIVNAAVERTKTNKPIGKTRTRTYLLVLVVGIGQTGVEVAVRLGDLRLGAFLIERTPFIDGKALRLRTLQLRELTTRALATI